MLRSESTKYTSSSPISSSTGSFGSLLLRLDQSVLLIGKEVDPIKGTKRRDARTTTNGYVGPDDGFVFGGA
jgi:hypothetical protein